VWIALLLSAFFLLRNLEIRAQRVTVLISVLAPLVMLVVAVLLLRPRWRKAYPSPTAAPADVGDETSHIEHLLAPLPDSTYRQLVAAVIYAFDPHATLSVGALVDTADGTRRVDIEVRSSGKDGAPFLGAIDVLDLPSGRKADIALVDAADSKRTDIKADAMLFCSNTGFEPDAISKAKRKNIGLISVLRQGDQPVKAIIEEEIYLREITLQDLHLTWSGSGLRNDGMPAYNGGSISDWLEVHAGLIAAANPEVTFEILKDFNFKEPIQFEGNGRQITLTSMAVSFTPQVQWLSQTVQLDAQAGIYDYVRGRVRLAPGGNSYTVSGIGFDHAKPLSVPPDLTQKGLEHRPGDVEFALIDVTPAPLPGTIIPKMDDLVRPEGLHLKLTDEELRALKLRADQRK
jgi:hypothetical protein